MYETVLRQVEDTVVVHFLVKKNDPLPGTGNDPGLRLSACIGGGVTCGKEICRNGVVQRERRQEPRHCHPLHGPMGGDIPQNCKLHWQVFKKNTLVAESIFPILLISHLHRWPQLKG